METQATITMHGNVLHLSGNEINVGDAAPEFQVLANDLSPRSLSTYKGKRIVFITVPSLDTPVCDKETRRFNVEAGAMGKDTIVLVASMDLPFAQSRWCGAAGAGNVETISDFNSASAGTAFGMLIKEIRLLARSIFIIDKNGVVRYKQVVKEATNEPDYEEVLKALKTI
jgi:thioredoxin-dependent peroxiredoxin